jgi:peptidoglycan hydrolase CwlO-like protein
VTSLNTELETLKAAHVALETKVTELDEKLEADCSELDEDEDEVDEEGEEVDEEEDDEGEEFEPDDFDGAKVLKALRALKTQDQQAALSAIMQKTGTQKVRLPDVLKNKDLAFAAAEVLNESYDVDAYDLLKD